MKILKASWRHTCRNMWPSHEQFYISKEDFEIGIFLANYVRLMQIWSEFILINSISLVHLGHSQHEERMLLVQSFQQHLIDTFILVEINYFTKWVETTSHKSLTNKIMDDFLKNNIICRFRILESIIIDNGTNLNSDLMRLLYHKYKSSYRNSTNNRPHINGVVRLQIRTSRGHWTRRSMIT